MIQLETEKKLAAARASLYRLLGGFYIMEMDEETLEQMKKIVFPEEGSSDEMTAAYQMLEDYLHNCREEDLEDLAVDYAKTFLAAGDAAGLAAFPYESVYVSRRHEIGGRTEQEVLALYALHGWEPTTEMYRTMNDHIGLELEFMAVLCEEEVLSCQTANADRAAMCRRDEKEFLETHLAWAESFCNDVKKYAQTEFYQGIAALTKAFLEQEKELLGGALWDIA